MEELTIYTLTSMIRSFSNEITTKALAHKLGISYSTLARCKNGIWPPSITFDAMKNVIDGCLAEYFSDDTDAFVGSALGFLKRSQIETESLREQYDVYGFDAFVTMLICAAKNESEQNRLQDAVIDESLQSSGYISSKNALALLFAGTLVVKLVDALFLLSLYHRFQILYFKREGIGIRKNCLRS